MTKDNSLKETKRQIEFMHKAGKIVEQRSKALSRPLYAMTVTFGCQMNFRDSEKIDGALREMGFLKASSEEQADVLIYNTCTVRENADKRLFG